MDANDLPFPLNHPVEHPGALLQDRREVEAVRAFQPQAELAYMARFEGGYDERVLSSCPICQTKNQARLIAYKAIHTRDAPKCMRVTVDIGAG